MNYTATFFAILPWLVLLVLAVLLFRFTYFTFKRVAAYRKLVAYGRLQDRVRFEQLDTQFAHTTLLLIAYTSIGLSITLFI